MPKSQQLQHVSGDVRMPRTPELPDDIAVLIKRELWDGSRGMDIAERVGVSESLVSHIKLGRAYAYIPWPDGSTGPMPEYHRLSLMKSRQRITRHKTILEKGTARRYSTFHDLTREEIEEAEALIIARIERDQQELRNAVAERLIRENGWVPDPSRPFLPARNPNPEPTERREPSPVKFDPDANPHMPWDRITEKAGHLPIVREAEDDEHLKEAVQIIFQQTGQSMWGMQEIANIIRNVRRDVAEARGVLEAA